MIRLTRAVAAVVSLTTVLLLAPMPSADAYKLLGKGCRYDPKNDNDGLGIAFDKGNSHYNTSEDLRTQYGASDWNAKMTPQFTIVSPYTASTRDLGITWSALGANVGAQTSYSCGSDHYTKDPIFAWSTNETYYTKNQDRQVAVAVHEIGHSYGLDHNQNTSCNGSVAGLMYSDAVGKYDQCGWTNPTTDDVNGATKAHNGG